MALFDEAGFELGDVDRRYEPSYPAGRLELWTLAKWTSGQGIKEKPIEDVRRWPVLDLTGIQVVKALPAWIPVLKAAGVNYWVASCRGKPPCIATRFEHNEVINANLAVDPHEIWARAYDYTNPAPARRRADARDQADRAQSNGQ